MTRTRTQSAAGPGGQAAPKILTVCNVDQMAEAFLGPWLDALREAGYEVHLACRRSDSPRRMELPGIRVHDIPFQRRFNPFLNVEALWVLWWLMRRERFDAVTCHSPVAGAVGRIAARLAGVPRVIYTVHGFYFHEETPAPLRRLLVAAEWLLGRLTTHFAFVSEEDRQTALRTGIAASERQTTTIHDGIDLARFSGASSAGDEAAFERALQARARGCAVVGIVARLVREKGYQEFLAMARRVAGAGREVVFLVIGRSLPTDRDRFEETFKREIREAGLEDRFILAGFTSKVPAYLGLMDVFVLPSYREGLPRSILEAMGAGLPVVATDIRGCREEVVHGETGLIVPPRNAEAVSEAVLFLLDHPDQAAEMGRAGRRRAAELYDQRQVCRRFVKIFRGLFHAGRLAAGSPVRLAPEEKHVA